MAALSSLIVSVLSILLSLLYFSEGWLVQRSRYIKIFRMEEPTPLSPWPADIPVRFWQGDDFLYW